MRLFLILLFSLSLEAKELLVRAPQVSKSDYSYFLQLNPQYESLEQRWHQQNLQNSKKLRGLFLAAKYEFLNGSHKKAEALYRQIAEQIYSSDWLLDARKMITISLFRLAQIDSSNSDYWIEQAALFDDNLPPDEKLFPPPFQKKWQTSQASLTKTKWQPGWPLEIMDKVIINGKIHNPQIYPSYLLNKNANRVTIISNCGFIESVEGSYAKIATHIWSLTRVAQGSCSDYKINSLNQLQNFQVLFPHQCVVKHNNKKPLDIKPPAIQNTKAKELNLASKAPIQKVRTQKKATNHWYKNKWIWWSLGLAAGYYIYHENNKEDKAAPVHVRVNPTHERE